LLRSAPDLGAAASADPLDKHIFRRIALHGNIASKFPDVDLTNMDTSAKRALLADMQRLLAIKPVLFRPS
jgi:hypothetical protein